MIGTLLDLDQKYLEELAIKVGKAKLLEAVDYLQHLEQHSAPEIPDNPQCVSPSLFSRLKKFLSRKSL